MITTLILVAGSFVLGSIPFSVLLGRIVLGKDITKYGDGNPGAANVFRAGSPVLGFIAVLLDLGKGVPFLLLARLYYDSPPAALVVIGIASILGHAYSPMLRFKGGKAVSVTFGTLIGMLEPAMLFSFTVSVILGAITLKNHSWVVMMGPAGATIFLIITGSPGWQMFYIFLIAVVFAAKHHSQLSESPGFNHRIESAITLLMGRHR
ncbi:MAG: glycerol-3-phosphate acyltransferase [Dehalococcoidaceae bacterium]|nr:glycerol-3-phosphate acyltransferase [Dehalococcoidaceae bacterium]